MTIDQLLRLPPSQQLDYLGKLPSKQLASILILLAKALKEVEEGKTETVTTTVTTYPLPTTSTKDINLLHNHSKDTSL